MKTIKLLAVAVILVVASAFRADTGGYEVGQLADDFNLKNVDGKMVSLKSFPEAKGFIIIFTCNHCPFAKAYEDRIIDLDKKYSKKGYPVIAINPNNPEKQKEDSYALMQERAAQKKFTFPYLFDEGQKVYPKFGATKTPHVYIVEKTTNGNVVRYIGAIDDNYEDASAAKQKYVENAVDALLKGQDVPVKQTKAIGCSIKV